MFSHALIGCPGRAKPNLAGRCAVEEDICISASWRGAGRVFEIPMRGWHCGPPANLHGPSHDSALFLFDREFIISSRGHRFHLSLEIVRAQNARNCPPRPCSSGELS